MFAYIFSHLYGLANKSVGSCCCEGVNVFLRHLGSALWGGVNMVLMHVEWGGVRVGSILCFGGLETVILSSWCNELGVLKALMNNDVWILIRETWASIDYGLNWRFFGIGFGGASRFRKLAALRLKACESDVCGSPCWVACFLPECQL